MCKNCYSTTKKLRIVMVVFMSKFLSNEMARSIFVQ